MIVINRQMTWWHQALVIFEKILKNQFLFCIWIKLVFFFVKKWCFFADLSFFEMKFCLRAILGIWLKIEDKILLDDCNQPPNLVTSSACYFWKKSWKINFCSASELNLFFFCQKMMFFCRSFIFWDKILS